MKSPSSTGVRAAAPARTPTHSTTCQPNASPYEPVPSTVGYLVSAGRRVTSGVRLFCPHVMRKQAYRGLRVPTHRRPEEQQPGTDEHEPRNDGADHRHAARVGHRI